MFFIHPHYLWLLLLLVPLIWQHQRHRTSLGAVSLWSIAGLRALAATALIIALARPVLLRDDQSRTIVHLIDVSAGVDQLAIDKVVGDVEHTMKEAKKKEQHKVILFAEEPWQVASLKSLGKDVAWHRKKSHQGSNLAAAIDLAAASVREGSKGEVRLYSDGRVTAGNTMAAVRDLARRGIPLKTITIGKPLKRELILSDVKAAPTAMLGETLPVKLTIEATDPGVVGISVTDEMKDEVFARDFAVEACRQTLDLTIPLTQQGTVVYDVLIKGKNDTLASNNKKQLAVEVLAPYRVGLIGTSELKPLSELLAISSEVKEISLKALKKEKPSQKDSLLDQFDLIVLADTPASQLDATAADRLAHAVQNGCGLLVTGGKRSFGPGGYLNDSLSKMLPVRSIQKMEQRDPSATLVIIIDTSGSMGGSRVQLAKEIARLAIKRLKPHDKAGVVEFYGSKRWAAPIQPASNAIDINRALNRLSAGGGTVILPAIEESYFALLNVRTRTKHILVLTDGGIETGAFEPLIRKMADHGMTLSTVLVGPSTHSTFLTRLAQWGRGKSYHAPSRFNLPEILIKQPESSLLSPWIERATQMTLVDRSVLTDDLNIDHAPLLTGYVETEARPTADVLIGSKLDHPILARWQYGLGHVATLTTQLAGPWSEELVKWDGYGPLFAGLTRSLARRTDRMPIQFTCTVGPEGLTVFAKSTKFDEEDRASSLDLALTGVWGEEISQKTLEPIQPGQWLTRIPLGSLIAAQDDQKVLRLEAKTSTGTLSSAAVVVGAKDEFCTVAPAKTAMADWEQACHKMLTQKNKEEDTVASQAVSPVELRSLLIILALILFFVQVALRRVLPSRRLAVNAPKNLAASATAGLVLVLALMTGTASAAMEKPAEDLLPDDVIVRVQTLYQKGKSEDARAMLKQTVAAAAPSEDVSSHAARLAWIYGDSKTAAELLKPKGEGKYLCREELLKGTLLLETDQPARAMKYFREAYKNASTPTDRRFAMAMEIHSARKAQKLDQLANEWLELKPEQLHAEQVQALIQILGELDRHADAFGLVERPGFSDELSVKLQKEVVSLAIDAGKTEKAMQVYHQLLKKKPHYTPYLSATARLYLLEDRRAEAIKLFEDAIKATTIKRPMKLMHLADAAADSALYDQAKMALAKAAKSSDVARIKAMIQKVDLVRRAGDPDKALEMLVSIRPLLDDHPKQLLAVAEAYDRYGDHVEAFALLKKLYKKTKSEDILAQVAWLSEESGDTEAAYTYWLALWRQTKVPARRRHAKTRMLDLASRNGKLVDMVLDIEEKLDIDQATREEVMLLVDIYSQTNDPISASEILYTFGKKFGDLDAAKRLVRVYIDCELFARAEAQLYKLVKMDPKHAGDYYEQIAMLAVERGRPYKAFQVTQKLLASKNASNHAAEFSAGVYELLKMYDKAILAYENACKKHPNHIEIRLLWGRAMKQAGRTDEAIQWFLNKAKTCEKDDQFVIAIDGLLNLDAGPKILQEALSMIERRLANRWDKVFLYDLACDLLDNLGESRRKLRILQQSLVAAGMRRPTVLRQLMDEAALVGNSTEENIVVDYGRVLLSLGDEVPPTVFLQIGQAMLNANDVKTAATIFRRAGVHGGFAEIGRRVAELYQASGRAKQAESMLHELLITEPDAIDLLIQAGGLSEQTGRFQRAFDSYFKAVNLLLDRVPPVVRAKAAKPTGRRRYYRRNYNLSEVQLYLEQASLGLITSARTSESQTRILDSLLKQTEQELVDLKKEDNLKKTLEENPRLARRSELFRRVAFALHRPDCAIQIDQTLIKAYPQQKDLLNNTASEYFLWGFNKVGSRLIGRHPLPRKTMGLETYKILKNKKKVANYLKNPGSLGNKFAGFIPALLAKGHDKEEVREMLTKLSSHQCATGTAFKAAYALNDTQAIAEWAKKRIKIIPSHIRSSGGRIRKSKSQIQYVIELAWTNLDEKSRKTFLERLSKATGKNHRGNPELTQLRLELTTRGKAFMDKVLQNESILRNLMIQRNYRSIRNLHGWFSMMSPEMRIKTLQLGCKMNSGHRRRTFLMEVLCEVDLLNDAELCDTIVDLFKKAQPFKWNSQSAYHLLTQRPWYRLKSPAGKKAGAEIAEQLMKDYPSENLVKVLHAIATVRQFSGSNSEKPSTKPSKEALEARKLALKSLDLLVSRKTVSYQVQRLLLDIAMALPASDIGATEKFLKEKIEKSGMTTAIAFTQYAIHKRQGNTELALEMLKKIFELAPGERTSSYAYFTVMQRLGRDADLADLLSKKVSAASAESSLCTTLSTIYGRLHRFDDAILVARQDNSSQSSSSSTVRIVGLEAARGNSEGALREIRRFFIQGRKSRAYFYASGLFHEYKGGMHEYFKQCKAASVGYRDRKGIYELLADQPFAAEEWENMLRAATPKSSDLSNIIIGYGKALTLAGKAEQKIEEIHARHVRGVAGQKDYSLLLVLLSELPKQSEDNINESLPELNELLLAVDWYNHKSVASLAASLSKTGHKEEARTMFRWAIATALWSRQNDFQYPNTWEIVDSLVETYPVKERPEQMFQVLKRLKPAPIGSNFCDVLEQKRFKRFLSLVGTCPEATESLQEEAEMFRERINRNFTLPAKATLATLAALEAALDHEDAFRKTMQKALDTKPVKNYGTPMFFDYRTLLPPASAMKKPEKYLMAVIKELQQRNQDNELKNSEYVRALSLLGNWQATSQFETSVLRKELDKAAKDMETKGLFEVDPATTLWMIDSYQQLGDADSAYRLSKRLLENRNLPPARFPWLFGEIKKREGKEALQKAIKIGKSYSGHTILKKPLSKI